MALRTRDKAGNTTPIDGAVAVEFLDSTGRLAAVITQTHDGLVEVVKPGDQVFNAYLHIHKMRAAKVVQHEPFVGKPLHF